MKKVWIVFLFLFLCLNLFSQTSRSEDQNDPDDIKYRFELIKFYLDHNEYDLVISYIDSTLEEAINKDTLYYMKGLACKGMKDWDKASDSFAETFIRSNDPQLNIMAEKEFKNAITTLSPVHAIEKISYYISRIEDQHKLTIFLFIIAEIYEKNQLFGEANDVYRTILQETEYTDSISLELKIATNHIFLKEYNESLQILEPIIAQQDSVVNENALFYHYIANYSLQQFEAAKSSLLTLYLHYPEHPNRHEIIKGLAELYEIEHQYLLSWYLLNELYNLSNDAQRFNIHRDIGRIKKMLVQDTLSIDQFKDFKPVFEEIENGE
jgi:hypothetical protein